MWAGSPQVGLLGNDQGKVCPSTNIRHTMWIPQVEVASRAFACGLCPESHLAETILSYYQTLGYLVSCAADLRPYTSRLGPEAARALALRLSETFSAGLPPLSACEGGGPAAAENQKMVRRYVCGQQLLDDLGLPVLTSTQDAVQHAGGFLSSFSEA